MANTLETTQKGTIDDDTDHALPAGSFSAVSSDTTIATVASIGGFLYAVAQGAGTATITATRNADNATATMDVTVTGGSPFTIHLGALSAK